MIRVGVVRGGTGNHYAESLASGAYVLAHLPKEKYQTVDIFIDRDGVWHINGIPAGHDALKTKVDIVWNALHGFYGEDGKLAQLLETMGIPYTGTGMLSSAILSHNKLAKERFVELGFKTPRALYVEDWGSGDAYQIALQVTKAVFNKYAPPWKVVPISRAYGEEGVVCKTQDELTAYLKTMCELRIPVMVEEVVLGKDVSVVVMPGFRNNKDYTLLPANIRTPHVRLTKKESEELQSIAKMLHHNLHLGPYSHVRACMNAKGHVYICGIDTVPDTSESSLLHHSLQEVGALFPEFARHLIDSALRS